MIFYEQETLIGLCWAALPALLSLYFYFWQKDEKSAILLLLLSALMVRLVMISLDPFIHEWDERYHALVAKNMMTNPFKPMLITDPIFPYDVNDWSGNHIWVHKQPLFLWQMALSMKIFGVSPFAVRLPSAILGTVAVFFIYDIVRKWISDTRPAYLAAWMSAFAYYGLELTSGWRSLEHNDVVFYVYITAAIWALVRYIHSGYALKWAVVIGILTGLAILVKWLTALVVLGGWGLYILQSKQLRTNLRYYGHVALAAGIAACIAAPWQLYILNTFPAEAAASYAHNKMHITSSLGHNGDVFTHFQNLSWSYHISLVVFIIPGMVASFLLRKSDKKLSVAFIGMIAVVYAFFSIVVKTKMPGLVYLVSGLLIAFMAIGIFAMFNLLFRKWENQKQLQSATWSIAFVVAGWLSLMPNVIARDRSIHHEYRNIKIHNATVYKQLPEEVLQERVILNCLSHNHIELMFYRNAHAFHWFPEQAMIDSLKREGYKFAAFRNVPGQGLPQYITDDPNILILEDVIR